MMKSVVIAALLLTAVPARADPPLAPTGKWIVNYEDIDCILSHDFGSGATLTTVGFKPSPFGDNVEVVTLTVGAKGGSRKSTAKLTLQPSGLAVEADAYVYALPVKNRTLATMTAEAEAAAKLRTSTGITLAIVDGPLTTVTMTGTSSAFGVLKACQTDLVKGWGLDPTELDKIATAPASVSPATWITNDDYPSDALSNEQQGTSVILWTVDIQGRVSDCRIIKSSGATSLDRAACAAITKRGRYTPAIGKDDKPMAAHQMRKIAWRLPS